MPLQHRSPRFFARFTGRGFFCRQSLLSLLSIESRGRQLCALGHQVVHLALVLLLLGWSSFGHAQQEGIPVSALDISGDFSFWEVLTSNTAAGDRTYRVTNSGFDMVDFMPESGSPNDLTIVGGTCSVGSLTSLAPGESCNFVAHFDEMANSGDDLSLKLGITSYEFLCFEGDDGYCGGGEDELPSLKGVKGVKNTQSREGLIELRRTYTISAKERSQALLAATDVADFEDVPVGESVQQSFSVTNTPSLGSMLNVDATAIDVGDFQSSAFQLVGHNCGALAAEQSCTVDVEFSPQSANEFSDSLAISYFNGASTETISISVAGDTPSGDTGEEPGTENELSPGLISMRDSAVTVLESDQEITLTVDRLSGASISSEFVQVQVQFIDGTAVSDQDYVITASQLSWSTGNSDSKTITIPIQADGIEEPDETFTVRLTTETEGVIDPDFQQTVVTITDSGSGNEPGDNEPGPVIEPEADTQQYRIVIVSDAEQSASVGDTLQPLIVEVRDANTGVPVSGIDVDWRVVPGSSATLVGASTTVSGDDGRTQNQATISDTGFIRVVAAVESAEPVVNPPVIDNEIEGLDEFSAAKNLTSSAAQRVSPPPLGLQAGTEVAFLIRVGLEAIADLTRNQSRTGAVLDDFCASLADLDTQPAVGTAAYDLTQTCNAVSDPGATAVLGDNLDRLAPDEYFSMSAVLVQLAELQITNVYGRIAAIRSGQADQLDLSALKFQIQDQSISGQVLDAAQDSLFDFSGGAGASEGLLSRLGVFVSGGLSVGEYDGKNVEQSADYTSNRILFGADYRINQNIVVGAGLGFGAGTTDFSDTRGGLDVTAFDFTLFGTWYEGDQGYLDVVLDVGQTDFTLERQININGQTTAIADAKTDASVVALSLAAGKNFSRSGYEFGPYLRMTVKSASVGGFAESTDSTTEGFGSTLDVESHSVKSTRVAIGGQVSKSFSTRRAVVVPAFRFEFETENEKTKDGITASFQADPDDTPFTIEGLSRDTSYANLGIGATALFRNGKSAYAFYESRLLHDNVALHWLKVGFRLEF